MSELIQVDFKRRSVTSRQDLEALPEVIEWKASKDPLFKEFVAGLAMAAESFKALGGDWTRAVIVMHDKPPGRDEICFTIWDSNIQKNEEVSDALMMACSKVEGDGSDEPE